MKVIVFLDVDGVLNSYDTQENGPSGCVGIEDRYVRQLGEIVHRWDAEIILTSTWKDDWNKESGWRSKDFLYLMDKLAKYNMEITDKTFDATWGGRGKGIRYYLEQLGEDVAFVILDDYDFDFYQCGFSDNFVEICDQGLTGLRDFQVARANEIIERQMKEVD